MKDPDRKGKEKGKEMEGVVPEKTAAARTQRLRRIKEQVKDGTYRVDSGAVAEKMVDDAVEKIRSRARIH